MIVLAFAILLSTVLFLVDKNKKWSTFWRFTRRSVVVAMLLVAVGGSAFYLYQRHEAKVRAAAPNTLPADFDKWDK